MTNTKINRKGVITQTEFQATMDKATEIKNEYYKLRLRCMLAILKKIGKRRGELASLELEDVKVAGKNLSVTFTVLKKRRKTAETVTLGREKQIPLTDPLTNPIIEYLAYMKTKHPDCKYFFPSTTNVFGTTIHFNTEKHLSGRQILRLIQSVNPKAWVHLFRETVGAEIVRADPSLLSIYKVMMRLDLESEQTAWRYIRRYHIDLIK